MPTNSTEARLSALEAAKLPNRFLIVWLEDGITPTQIHDWQATNPRGVVISVQYREDRIYANR
jgi:hypothetical protein